MVASRARPAPPSLKEQEDAKASEALSGVRAEPLVQSVLAAFPGAEIAGVRAYEPGAANRCHPPGRTARRTMKSALTTAWKTSFERALLAGSLFIATKGKQQCPT